jgi:hypothetical protein
LFKDIVAARFTGTDRLAAFQTAAAGAEYDCIHGHCGGTPILSHFKHFSEITVQLGIGSGRINEEEVSTS